MTADGRAMRFDVSSALLQGARDRQEDAVATAFSQGADLGFAVLSDGMGGHAAGDIASRIIVTEIFAELTIRTALPRFRTSGIPAMLREAVQAANRCLRANIDADPSMHGMGGTVISIVLANGRLHWISVGDSVLYLFRNGELIRLNEDHSMAPQIDLMVRKGLIDMEEARDHPQRNCLTSALFGQDIPAIDCPETPVPLRPDDLVLVASDGLEHLSEDGIAALLRRFRRRSSGDIANRLMAGITGMNDPEQDNTSLVVIKAGGRPEGARQNLMSLLPVESLLAGFQTLAPERRPLRRS